MNDDLKKRLIELKREKTILSKSLDLNYRNKEKKKELFFEISNLREEIKKTNFKIELRKAMNNEKPR